MMGLLVAFYSRELLFETNLVFAFLILQSFAAIAAAKSLAVFSDRIGSSPLILFSSSSLALLSILWIFISSGIIFPLFLGFITCFFLHFNNYLIMRLIINKMLPGKEVTFMSMINFTASFFSFFIGLYSGALIDLYDHFFNGAGNSFSFVFISTALISVVNAVLALKLLRMKTEIRAAGTGPRESTEVFSNKAAVFPVLNGSSSIAKKKKSPKVEWWELTGYL